MPEDPTDLPPITTEVEATDPPEEQQTSQQTAEPTPQPIVHDWILLAMEDLAHRLSIATSEIELLSFEEKVWSDAGLGCPQPGMSYAQVLQEGDLIQLGAGDKTYSYHGGGSSSSDPFLCEQPGPEIIITKQAPFNIKEAPTKSVPPPID